VKKLTSPKKVYMECASFSWFTGKNWRVVFNHTRKCV